MTEGSLPSLSHILQSLCICQFTALINLWKDEPVPFFLEASREGLLSNIDP